MEQQVPGYCGRREHDVLQNQRLEGPAAKSPWRERQVEDVQGLVGQFLS